MDACFVCFASLSSMDAASQQVHINHCLDKQQKQNKKKKTKQKKKTALQLGASEKEDTFAFQAEKVAKSKQQNVRTASKQQTPGEEKGWGPDTGVYVVQQLELVMCVWMYVYVSVSVYRPVSVGISVVVGVCGCVHQDFHIVYRIV